MAANEFIVHREVLIHAPAEAIFGFFTEPEKLAAWFGAGSTIEARKGGEVSIRFPDGSPAQGKVLEIDAPRRIVFTWGYPREGSPIAPGATTIEVTLADKPDGTLVSLKHRLPTQESADQHAGGWAYHMARLSSQAARAFYAEPASAAVDAWFAAWATEGDESAKHLSAGVTEDVVYRDDAAIASSRAELHDHIARCHKFMHGVKMVRTGPVFQVADEALCDAAMEAAGKQFGTVRLAFKLARDGRIRHATGFFESAIPGVSDGTAISGKGETAAQSTAIQPHLWCDDLEATRKWYEAALGFKVAASYPAEGAPTWYQLERSGVQVMLARRPGEKQPPEMASMMKAAGARIGSGGSVSLYLPVDDASAARTRASEAKAKVVEELWEPFWGGRQFSVEDPDGIWWTVTGPKP